MTIDVGQSIQTLVFYGEIPDNTGTDPVGYRLRFVSRYSNKFVDKFDCNVISISKNEYRTEMTVTFAISGSVEEDLEGYYKMLVEYNPTQELWSPWKNVLVKVLNGDADFEEPIEYESDNENNEQIIYYENE